MRSGVSFPSYADTVSWAAAGIDASFPVANLSDLYKPRRRTKKTATGAVTFTGTLPAAKPIQFVGVVHHNLPAGSTIRVQAGAYDSGAVAVPTTVDGYLPVFPCAFPTAQTTDTVVVTITPGSAIAVAVGAIEVSGWWEWPDVEVPRSFGFNSQDSSTDMPLGATDMTWSWSPRVWSGSRSVISLTEAQATALDFQLEKSVYRPFVFCWDAADPTTWPRESILVRNASLPTVVVDDAESGSFQFSFVEHLR